MKKSKEAANILDRPKEAVPAVLKSSYAELSMSEFNALIWGKNCKFGIACRKTKILLHASDSEAFITSIYNQLRDPKQLRDSKMLRNPYGGYNIDIQMVTR